MQCHISRQQEQLKFTENVATRLLNIIWNKPLWIQLYRQATLFGKTRLPHSEGCKEAPIHIVPHAQFVHTGNNVEEKGGNDYAWHRRKNKYRRKTLLKWYPALSPHA